MNWKKNDGKKYLKLTFATEGDHPLFGAWLGFRDRVKRLKDEPNALPVGWYDNIETFAKEVPEYPTDGGVYKLMQNKQGQGYTPENMKWEIAYTPRKVKS